MLVAHQRGLSRRDGRDPPKKLIALARALYLQVDTKAASFFGFTVDDFDEGPVDIYPENQKAFELFCRLDTQWRAGAAGPYGLDHNVLFRHLDRMNLPTEEYDRLFDDIRVMEVAALDAMHEGKDDG